MLRRSLVGGVALVIALASTAHGDRAQVTVADWVARGDAAMAQHAYARAMADYAHAAGRWGTKPADLASKYHAAAVGWLQNELATRCAAIAPDHPQDVLRVVDAIHELAPKLEVTPEEVGYIEVGDQAARALWKAHLAKVPAGATRWEAMGYMRGVMYTVPSYLPVEAEIKADIARRYAEVRAEIQALLDKTPVTHPGARLMHETVLAGLDETTLDRERERKALAQRVTLDARVTIAAGPGCPQIAQGVASANAAAPKGGQHVVVIKVAAGGTCSPSEDVKARTRVTKEQAHQREPYEVHTRRDPVCVRQVERDCVRTANGRECQHREICTDLPDKIETKYRDVDVIATKREAIKDHSITIAIRAPYTIEIDGTTTAGNLDTDAIASEEWPDDGSVPTWKLTPASVLASSAADRVAWQLALDLKNVGYHMERELETSALAKAARGDLDGAADDLMTLLATPPASFSAGFEALAARAGLPYDTWRELLLGKGSPSLPTTDPERGALIELGVPELQPDQDLLDLEHHGGPHVDAPRDAARIVDDMLGRVAIGLGVAQWHGKDSDNDSAWGVDVVVGSQKSYGYKRFWSRELAASVGIRAPVATSIEGLFRLGAGLRSTGVGLTAYGVGGVSRRGDSGDFDLGLPIGIEAGAGGKLTLGSGHARRVEVLGEQLWRLGADAGAVDARLRFELRYVRARPADTGYGVRGWCAFEKVAGTTAIRTCTLAGELGF